MPRPRARYALLVVTLGFLGTFFVAVQPASALATCPTGLVPGVQLLGGGVKCFDAAGDFVGYSDGKGGFYRSPVSSVAVQSDLPSSVMASGEGASATSAEGAGLAEIEAAAGDGSVLGLADAPALGTVAGSILVAGFTGYEIGNGITSAACKFGLTVLCYPKKNTTSHTANSDVNISADPGFVPGQTLTQTSTQSTSSNHPAVTITIGWTTTPLASSGSGWTAGKLAIAVSPSNAGTQSVPVDVYGYGDTVRVSTGSALNNATIGGTSAQGLGKIVFCASPSPATVGTALNQSCSQTVTYYPSGDAARPGTPSANPPRQWVVTNVCSDSAHTVRTASSASFTETDATLPPAPTPAACPAGSQVVTSTLSELNTQSGQSQTISTLTVPSSVTTWQQTYPGCQAGVCKLGLYKVSAPWSTSSPDNCWSGGTPSSDCDGWFSDPTKSSDYVCTYGSANSYADAHVSLSECNVYSPSFSASKQAAGVPYGDPATGTAPSTTPVVSTPSAGDPDTGGSVTTAPDVSGLPGQHGESCWPSGFSAFNPLEWVLQPVKCALAWAFVPDSTTVASLKSSVSSSIDTSNVGPWVNVFGGLFPGAGTGCQGPNVALPMISGNQSFYPFSACDDPVATVAAISRAVTTVGIIIGGGWSCMNAVTTAFGYRDD